ncbi:MAG: hypothetical protein GXX78_08115 [Bacteroidales bacterium]|nr:hypothetical protein [Bacteroidales bacterium]
MKRNILFCGVILIVFIASCTQKTKETEEINRVENTLKSVSFLEDSIGISSSELLSIFDRINEKIDSIGYPDAGYKLWVIQGDSIKNLRFMVEGYWPNQAIYDTIHNNKLYQTTMTSADQQIMNKLRTISYYRFSVVK